MATHEVGTPGTSEVPAPSWEGLCSQFSQQAKPAGCPPKTGFAADDCSRHILQPDLYAPSAPLPDSQDRSSRRGRCAALLPDKELSPNWSGHGRPSRRSESVGAVVQAPKDWDFYQDMKEAVYESNRQEPLGQALRRGHQLPDRVLDSRFRFGRVTNGPQNALEQNGRDLISPEVQLVEDPIVHEQYVRSHYSFAPGEQMQRRYAWPSEVAKDASFRFGHSLCVKKCPKDCVGNALLGGAWDSTNKDKENSPLSFGTQDNTQARDDTASQARHLRLQPPPVPADFSFGAPSPKSSGSAADAVYGQYSHEEQQPDRDLGKCLKQGRRNIDWAPDNGYGKPSGLPRALQRPSSLGALAKSRSTSNSVDPVTPTRPKPRHAHYDGGASPLVSPDCYSTPEARADFKRLRSRSEIRALLRGAGYKLPPEEFTKLWASVASPSAANGKPGMVASLESITEAYSQEKPAGRSQGGALPARQLHY